MTAAESNNAEQVVATAHDAKDLVEHGIGRLVKIALVTAVIVVVLFVGQLAVNGVALWSYHNAQAAGGARSEKILQTVTSHNTELAQTLNAACILIKSDPALPVPAGCKGHFVGPHVHAKAKS